MKLVARLRGALVCALLVSAAPALAQAPCPPGITGPCSTIDGLPAALPLTGTEEFAAWQSPHTVKVTLPQLRDLTSSGALILQIANASSTGTTVGLLAKLTGAPSSVVVTATTDTGGVIGVVVGEVTLTGCTIGCTTGTAQIAIGGQASVQFDGGITSGDYVTISSTSVGKAHDAGATYPTTGSQVLGRVIAATNASAGTYAIEVFPPEINSTAAVSLNTLPLLELLPNNATGTGTGLVAKFTSTGAQTATTSDTGNSIGVCYQNCGTTGSAYIAINGQVQVQFDGGVTEGDWVVVSTTSGGKVHDTGLPATPANLPGGVSVLGVEISATNGSAGTYTLDLNNFGVTAAIAANTAFLNVADQVLSGGFRVTSDNLGTPTNGSTTTIDCGARPLQYLTNNVAGLTIAAPSNDGNCDVMIINGASAGTVSFSGFSVGSSKGDSLDTTNGHIFTIGIWRINGTAGYRVAAHQ